MKLSKGVFSRFLGLAIVAGLLVFTGCSDDDPSNPGSESVTKAGVGSEFVYNEYETENDAKVDGTDQTVTMTVMEKDLTYQGKSEVYRWSEVYDGGDESTLYIRYESNNDVSLYFDEEEIPFGDPLWLKLPFGSRTEQNLTLIDTVAENDLGGFDTIRLKVKTTYVGEETVQYKGSALKVWVAKITISGIIPFPFVGQIQFNAESVMKFAPSLGFVYSTVETSDGGGLSSDTEGSVRILQSHTLK